MAGLSLLFLGQPRVESQDVEIALPRRKVLALLAYLAVSGRPHSRDELAELLYPDRDRDHSYSGLRQSLCYLREAIGTGWIETGPRTISLKRRKGLKVDVGEFRSRLDGGRGDQLAGAVRLCRGTFLSGFYLKDCPAFEHWQAGLEESLRQQCAAALEKLIALRCQDHDLDGAAAWARAAVDLDPLEESGHRSLMNILAAAGRRGLALRQYDHLRSLLSKELGQEPDAQTESLRSEILAGSLGQPAAPFALASLPETLETGFEALSKSLPSSVLSGITAPAHVENRLASVMFIRISPPRDSRHGSVTHISGELINQLLREMVDAFCRYEGRIVRFQGNQVIVVFGTPHIHEDDPQRAVLSALQIRECAGKHGFSVSSGIAAGEVDFLPAGHDERRGPGVTGPVVDRAARMQGRAKPGEILAAESAWRHLYRSFECVALSPEEEAGGVPVKAYRVERRRLRLEKARGLEGLRAELIGRDEELSRLSATLGEVLSGAGRMVSITGEAGVGKTRLIEELKGHALSGMDRGCHPFWFEGRCVELGMTVAYWPCIDLIGQLFGFTGQGAESGQACRVVEVLRGLKEAGQLTAERVREMGPLLGRLLSIHFGNEWDSALLRAPPEQVKHQTFLTIRDLFLAFARQRPLVLVLDDLHWADPLSIDLVEFLMESLTLAPILLLCIYRSEPNLRGRQLSTIASGICPERFIEIALRELTPSQSDRMIDSLLSVESLAEPVRGLILNCSQGNPFFVEEVIRSLIDSGVIYRVKDRWHARPDVAAIRVPETIQSVILGRVDQLEVRLKHLLESAAVIGRIFHRRVLEQAQQAEKLMDEALAELEDRALIRPESNAPEEAYSFRHVLMQQAVYQGIVHRRRSRLHRRVADAIESLYPDSIGDHVEQLAHHRDQAGETEEAVQYLLRAGRKAQDAWLNEAALERFQRVLDLCALPGARAEGAQLQALVESAKVYEVTGHHDRAEVSFRQAAALAERLSCTPRELARIQFLLCKAITTRHCPPEYLPIAEESLRLLRDDLDSPEALFAEFVLAYGSFEQGEYRPSCDFAARRGELFRSLPYSQDLAINSGYLAWANLLDKNDSEAMRWLDWLEREARMHNDLVSLAAAHVRRGRDMYGQRGDLARAVEELEQASGMYRKVGARYLEARSYLYVGDVYYRYGKLDAAQECLHRAEGMCDALDQHVHMRAEARMLGTQIALAKGDGAAALGALTAARDLKPGAQWELFMKLLTASALITEGRKAEAALVLTGLLGEAPSFRVPPAYSDSINIAHILSMLESCEERGDVFREFCDRLQCEHPEAKAMLSQWHVGPAAPRTYPHTIFSDDFSGSPDPGWSWHDPFGDCSLAFDGRCAIAAPVGRGLRGSNLGAPRLLRPARGPFAVQTACVPSSDRRLAVGGITVWKSPRDYLRLDVGSLGPQSVAFAGCFDNRDVVVGRGMLPAGRVWLRIERAGARVNALCSSDELRWHSVGDVSFPADELLEVGLFVDGLVHPELYPRTYAAGAEMRFARFDLLAGH